MSADVAPTWRCSACDTYNDAGARACAVCETPRTDPGLDPAPAPTPRRASVPAPVPKRAAKRAAKRDIDPLEHQPKPLWPLVVGCGCVLLLVTAVVVALILLIINLGSAIVSSAEHSPTLTEIDGGYPEPRSSPN